MTPPMLFGLAYAAPSPSVSVGTASTTILAAGTFGKSLTLATLPGSAGNVYLSLNGAAAAVGTGICIPKNGGSITFGMNAALPLPTGQINGISDDGTTMVLIQGA